MKTQTSSGGVGFCSLLFITLLILKLTGVINWSWWWVTAPLWIPAGLFVIIIVVIAFIVKRHR